MNIADFKAHADAIGRIAVQPAANAVDPATSMDTKSHQHKWYPWSWAIGKDGQPDYNRPVLMACPGRTTKGRCIATPRAEEVGAAFNPVDRVFVQASKGVMKFVAGNGETTVVINAGATDQTGYALVPSKLFLGAAKVLKGKADVDLKLDGKGLTLRTSQGGKVAMANVDTELPGYVRPEPVSSLALLPDKFWLQASKAVEAVAEKYWPYDHVSLVAGDDGVAMVMSGRTRMAEVSLPEWDMPGVLGAFNGQFIRALRNMKGETHLSWTENVVMVEAGAYQYTTLLRRHHPGFPHRDLYDADRPVVVEAPTKVLTDAVSLLPKDEMIDVTVKDGTLGLGAISVPVSHTERGQVRVDSGLLTKLVKAWPATKLKLSWGPNAPITLEGDTPWTMRLAPVA